MHRFTIGLLAIAVALGATACGSATKSSREASPNRAVTSQALSSNNATKGSGFVERADAICEETKSQLAASLQEAFRKIKNHALSERQASERQRSDEAQAAQTGVEKLTALKPPAELRSVYDRYLGVQRLRIELAPPGIASPAEARRLAKRYLTVNATAKKLVRTMGFNTCS